MVRDKEVTVYKLYTGKDFGQACDSGKFFYFCSLFGKIFFQFITLFTSHIVQRKTFINLNGNLFCKLILICTFDCYSSAHSHPRFSRNLLPEKLYRSLQVPSIGLSLQFFVPIVPRIMTSHSFVNMLLSLFPFP